MKKRILIALVVVLVLAATASVVWAGPPSPPKPGAHHTVATLLDASGQGWESPTAVVGADGWVKFFHKKDTFRANVHIFGLLPNHPYVFSLNAYAPGEQGGMPGPAEAYAAQGYSYDDGGQLTAPGGWWGNEKFIDLGVIWTDEEGQAGRGFNVRLPVGNYNVKMFVKDAEAFTIHDTHGTWNTIVLYNNLDGAPGAIDNPYDAANHDPDFVITQATAKLTMEGLDPPWCYPINCDLLANDYPNAGGEVRYDRLNTIFTGSVDVYGLQANKWYQLKLEGKPTCLYPSDGDDASNAAIGSIGRWWRKSPLPETNVTDAQVAANPGWCVQGYIVFDGVGTDASGTASKDFALDSSYITLWNPVSGRPAPGSVIMPAADYNVSFLITENAAWWRTVLINRNIKFTVYH